MKLTLNDLVAAQPALQRLARREAPAKIAFCLARNVRQTMPVLADYDVARKALLDRLGTPSEDKTQYTFKPEEQAEFNSEMQALLNTEIDIEITQIAEDDLPDLTAGDAMALWWLVEDDGETD